MSNTALTTVPPSPIATWPTNRPVCLQQTYSFRECFFKQTLCQSGHGFKANCEHCWRLVELGFESRLFHSAQDLSRYVSVADSVRVRVGKSTSSGITRETPRYTMGSRGIAEESRGIPRELRIGNTQGLPVGLNRMCAG